MEGYLYKKGTHFKSWRKRYFLIRLKVLEYYADFRKSKLIGTILIDGAQLCEYPGVLREHEKREGALFGITPLGSDRTFLLEAANEQERQQWATALVDRGANHIGLLSDEAAINRPELTIRQRNGPSLKRMNTQSSPHSRATIRKAHTSLKDGPLAVFSDSPTKPWKQRFVVVYPDRLEIFKNEKSPIVLETVYLWNPGLMVASSEHTKGKFSFTISSEDVRDPIQEKHFATESSEARDTWLETLLNIQAENCPPLLADRKREEAMFEALAEANPFCRELYSVFIDMVTVSPDNKQCGDLVKQAEAKVNHKPGRLAGVGFVEWAIKALLELLSFNASEPCRCGGVGSTALAISLAASNGGMSSCVHRFYRSFLQAKGPEVIQRGWYRMGARSDRERESVAGDEEEERDVLSAIIRLMWLLCEKQRSLDDKVCTSPLEVQHPGWGIFLHSSAVVVEPGETYVMYTLRLRIGSETRYYDRRFSELMLFYEGLKSCPVFKEGDCMSRIMPHFPKKTLSLHAVDEENTLKRKEAFRTFFYSLSSFYVWQTTLASPFFCSYFGIDRNASFIPLAVVRAPRERFKRAVAYGAINPLPAEAAAAVLFQLILDKPYTPGDPEPSMEDLSTLCMSSQRVSACFVELFPLFTCVGAHCTTGVRVSLLENLHLLLTMKEHHGEAVLCVPQWAQGLACFLSGKYRPPYYIPVTGHSLDIAFGPNATKREFTIQVRCRDLVKMDILSKSDPVVEVFLRDPITREFEFVDRTELIWNDHDPDFTKQFTVAYDPQILPVQELRFDVYDADYEVLRVVDRMGSVVVRLCELVMERDSEHLLVNREVPTRLANSTARMVLSVHPVSAHARPHTWRAKFASPVSGEKSAVVAVETRGNKLYTVPKSVITGTTELVHKRNLRARLDSLLSLTGGAGAALHPEECLVYFHELKSVGDDPIRDAIIITDQRLFITEGGKLRLWPRDQIKVTHEDKGALRHHRLIITAGESTYTVESITTEVAKFLVRVLVIVPTALHNTISTGPPTEVEVEIGDKVIVHIDQQPVCGIVIFKGFVHFGSGTWLGVALEEPLGDCNGTVDGIAYFACPPSVGVLVAPDQITVVDEGDDIPVASPALITSISPAHHHHSSPVRGSPASTLSGSVSPVLITPRKARNVQACKDPCTLAAAVFVGTLHCETGLKITPGAELCSDSLQLVVDALGDGHFWHPNLLLPVVRRLINSFLVASGNHVKTWVNNHDSPRWDRLMKMLSDLRAFVMYRPAETDSLPQESLGWGSWLLEVRPERQLARKGKGIGIVDSVVASNVLELLSKLKFESIEPSSMVDERERQRATKIRERGIRLTSVWVTLHNSLLTQEHGEREMSGKDMKEESINAMIHMPLSPRAPTRGGIVLPNTLRLT